MDKIRFKQSQMLLEKSVKSKKPEETLKAARDGVINSQIFSDVLNEMIDLEDFIYSSRPTHFLNRREAQEFSDRIVEIRNKLDDILADFGVIEKLNVEEEIKSLSLEYLILTTKSNFKKVLTRISVDPQRIVVAGVPLHIEDMKQINPHLPENALNSIEKKISHVKSDIDRKMGQFEIEEVLVVVEGDKTGEILAKRAEEFYNAHIITVESLKDISATEFLKLLVGL
jgi:hypothetical protein